jgi:pimeloyl-ACP methyl ester carboxylesterase
VRRNETVESEPGIEIGFRAVRAPGARGVPVVLLHNSRVPGTACFDLDVPNGSLAASLAAHGHDAFLPDIRGYGASTRPAEMDGEPAAERPAIVRSHEAVRDVAAVVDAVRAVATPS